MESEREHKTNRASIRRHPRLPGAFQRRKQASLHTQTALVHSEPLETNVHARHSAHMRQQLSSHAREAKLSPGGHNRRSYQVFVVVIAQVRSVSAELNATAADANVDVLDVVYLLAKRHIRLIGQGYTNTNAVHSDR